MSKIDWYFRSNLKFRHLQLLITLDELRHIGKTAEHLNISQPAVSKALAAFEEGLNIELFERTTRGMKPTEAGECLIRYARLMLNEMVNVRNELIDINEGRVTRISLGILPIASLCILPNFIALLESEMIATSITVREGTTDLLLSMLRANELDFVICNLTGKPLGIEFTSLPLYKDSIAVAVRRNHPLVTNEKISWQDLSGYSMILPPEFATTRFAIEEYLIYRGVDLAHRYVESVSTLTNIGILQRTDSVAFISHTVANHFEIKGEIAILPLKLEDIMIEIGLVWQTDRKLTPALETVIQLLKNTPFTDAFSGAGSPLFK